MPAECASVFSSGDGVVDPASSQPDGGADSRSYIQQLSSAVGDGVKSLLSPFRFEDEDGKDACQKYHAAYHVDVLSQVPPMKAFIITVNQMALEPLEFVGHAFGKFVSGKWAWVDCRPHAHVRIIYMYLFSGAFRHVPLHLWPIAVVLIIFAGLLLRGYHLGLGFGLISIGPSANDQGRLRDSNGGHANSENARPSIAQVFRS